MTTTTSNYNQTVQELKANGFKKHHSASRKGYCYKSYEGDSEEYSGRFGTGFIVLRGKYRGSNNYTEIEYWVK